MRHLKLLYHTFRNGTVVQGIVLGEQIANQRWTVLSLTERGQIVNHYRADVYFSIPNLVSANLAEQCGLTSSPTPQMTMARVEALKSLRALTSKVDRQAAGLQQRPMNIYVEVMSEDPTKWATTTVKHVTRLLYDKPLFMDYYMTHKYLMDNSMRYVVTPGYLKTQQFAVRPRRDIEEILAVKEYIREYHEDNVPDSVYETFVKKAAAVVDAYAKNKGNDSGPMSQEPAEVQWNETDQIFLRFLLRSMQPAQSNQLDPYAISRTTLVKDILRPKRHVTDATTQELLTKLGIISQWFDPFELMKVVNPYGDFTKKKTLDSDAAAIMKASISSRARTGTVLGPVDFLPEDPLDSVRHDFGDLRAFVIDDPSAEELDDAVSLERIPSEPENYWVHVHVADPTSILHPGHALAKLARERYSTFYLAHKTYPLWPHDLVHSNKYPLSLNEMGDKRPTKVMSFSIKLNKCGDTIDYKVRAGIIRDVRKTSYRDVDDALGFKPIPKKFPFGGSEEVVPGRALSAEDVADLKILQRLADIQADKINKAGVIIFSRSVCKVDYRSKTPEDMIMPSLQGSVFHGYPESVYSVYDTQEQIQGSRQLVAEMMKLANRISSRTLLDNGIPMIRRAMDPAIVSEQSLQILSTLQAAHGGVPIQELVKHLELNPVGQFTLEPAAHYALGVPKGEGYVRSTSPLRRFEDMVAHWQLQHLLKGPKASPRPPFSESDLESLMTEIESRSAMQKKIHKGEEVYHALLYIKRMLETRKQSSIKPLQRLTAWTQGIIKHDMFLNTPTVPVLLPELGILAKLDDMPIGRRDLPVGTQLFVKLKSIDLGIKRMKMTVTLHKDSL